LFIFGIFLCFISHFFLSSIINFLFFFLLLPTFLYIYFFLSCTYVDRKQTTARSAAGHKNIQIVIIFRKSGWKDFAAFENNPFISKEIGAACLGEILMSDHPHFKTFFFYKYLPRSAVVELRRV
jgi:hypothetical protein